LNEFQQIKHLSQSPKAIEMALWYHDVIYDTKAKDNEEKSAELAYQDCLDASLPKLFAEEVYDLILTTKHNVVPTQNDSQLLVDIDLSILGNPVSEFDKYERNIRAEYNWVPKNQFMTERKKVLQQFLNRDSIFLTDFFKKKYEKQARKNLSRSISNLNSME